MKGVTILIIGGGVAAGYAAKEFVECGIREGTLGIISADTQAPYERPPLSKEFMAGEVDFEEILINEVGFYRHNHIGVTLESRVERVNLEERHVETAAGERLGFEKLLIATGSRVRTFDLPGADLDGLSYLRWIDDAWRIRAQAEEAERAVVTGGGFIGMEIASQFAQRGIETTMVFPEERLMAPLFTPEMSAFFQRYYGERGVSIMRGAQVVSFTGEGQVSAVVLDSGEALPADLVVAGIGVEPATEPFEGSGLELEDGILVNQYLETNVSDVYAAGDVARYYDVLFEKRRRVEHWDNAAQQGAHAARVMAGEREPYVKLPYFFSDVFDLSWEFWGDKEIADTVVHRGDVASGSFSTWWLRGKRVVAAFVIDRPDEERTAAQEWIESGDPVSVERLADENRSLS